VMLSRSAASRASSTVPYEDVIVTSRVALSVAPSRSSSVRLRSPGDGLADSDRDSEIDGLTDAEVDRLSDLDGD